MTILETVTAALVATSGTIIVPEGQHPITWVFAECRAISAASSELDLPKNYYGHPSHEHYNYWNSKFWDIANLYFEDTREVSAYGNGRSIAKGLVAKELVLGKLNETNWFERLEICGNSYETMTKALLSTDN